MGAFDKIMLQHIEMNGIEHIREDIVETHVDNQYDFILFTVTVTAGYYRLMSTVKICKNARNQ